MKLIDLTIQEYLKPEGFDCPCGRRHNASPLCYLAIEPKAEEKLPEALHQMKVHRLFLVTGNHSEYILGKRVKEILNQQGIIYDSIMLSGIPKVLPNEHYVEILEKNFQGPYDLILGVGSGVINDLCKLTAKNHQLPCGIIATAPSMDGYASNSSAMELKGVKTTVYTTCPSLILCNTDVLKDAPEEMIRAGFGDMAAKIISIADWRMATLVTGEYYCSEVAEIMLKACRQIMEQAEQIQKRDEKAIRIMTEGLILSGIAMSFAVVSRPASGMEHTISHLMEMFALARGSEPAAHGLQVGYGTREALRLYEKAAVFTPSEEKTMKVCSSFEETQWEENLRQVFGPQAEPLISQALSERRNCPEEILKRGKKAIAHWPEISRNIQDVLRQKDEILRTLDLMKIPRLHEADQLGYSEEEAHNALLYSKDLRARYIFTSLCFDIGLPLD